MKNNCNELILLHLKKKKNVIDENLRTTRLLNTDTDLKYKKKKKNSKIWSRQIINHKIYENFQNRVKRDICHLFNW